MSSATEGNKATFITRTQVIEEARERPISRSGVIKEMREREERPDSPTTRAAKALEMLNNHRDEGIHSSDDESDEDIDKNYTIGKYRHLGDEALAEAEKLEGEMNAMFKELNQMENHIKANKDLRSMETLMDTTKEVIDTH